MRHSIILLLLVSPAYSQPAQSVVDGQGVYGKSTKGKDLVWYRVGTSGPKVLVTACIHGNETMSAYTVTAFLEQLRAKPVEGRQVYVIPIVSPDSYQRSREVDGVDPNRDFEDKDPVPPIKALKEFFTDQGFKGVISCHTGGGGEFLYPYGDSTKPCPDDDKYQQLLGRMNRTCGYRAMRGCQMYARGPIYGSELDWYYRHGATLSLVCELKTGQREVDNIAEAFRFFIEEVK